MNSIKSNSNIEQEKLLNWFAAIFGQFEILSDHSREHAGQRAAALRLRTGLGDCYVKIHPERADWEREVHGYERWAPAFGDFAPRLLAVRDEEPLALVISELPGKVLEEIQLSVSQERAVWRAAGKALSGLHDSAAGEWFGACRRDGTCAGTPVYDAREYVARDFDDLISRGRLGNMLSGAELAIVRSARDMIPAFEDEKPVPCHRDYCPANWLVRGEGAWTGVIDFEFSGWDVRVADFTRNPAWDWLRHPDRMEAFFGGYGRTFTPQEKQQLLVAHTQYALVAVVWGEENDYHGFAADGRKALKKVGELLR